LWLRAVKDTKNGEQKRRLIPKSERMTERVMMGLRLFQGIDYTTFHQQTGTNLRDHLDHDTLDLLESHGLLTQTATHLAVTRDGMKCLNAVLEKILL